jgi:CheY-like chemotaxis protein
MPEKPKILLVDDEPAITENPAPFLERYGFEIAVAANGKEALQFVDWNSRKPFLKDFYRIEEGMTSAQVDRIMASYIRENDGGLPGTERDDLVDGRLIFRHTDQGWGDSDLGVVTLKSGRVTETEFFPD